VSLAGRDLRHHLHRCRVDEGERRVAFVEDEKGFGAERRGKKERDERGLQHSRDCMRALMYADAVSQCFSGRQSPVCAFCRERLLG